MTEPCILTGIRVIEVGTYIFGPGAATVMSDFGAEVIKVERPKIGDPYRYLYQVPPMPVSEINYPWILDGRNKKSIALNLTKPEGRAVLLRLAATADVFLTNFQPSVLDRLRLTYEEVSPISERLIYAHATGYGEFGEEIEKPGFDMTAYWARSGLMDNVHNSDDDPCLSLAGMGDHPSAMALFGGIMLALYARHFSGRGTKVSSSLMANGAWANGCLIQAELCGADPYVSKTRSTAVNALVNHYLARDKKRFIFCLIQAEKDWPNLCRALGQPELIQDPRFASTEARAQNGSELIGAIDATIATKTMAEWTRIFAQHDLTWSPVSTLQEVANDAQMATNGVFVEMDHPQHGRLRTISSPISLQENRKVPPMPAPAVGEHTVEILRMLGYAEEKIQNLLELGIASTP